MVSSFKYYLCHFRNFRPVSSKATSGLLKDSLINREPSQPLHAELGIISTSMILAGTMIEELLDLRRNSISERMSYLTN